jgi:hypothetical protein
VSLAWHILASVCFSIVPCTHGPSWQALSKLAPHIQQVRSWRGGQAVQPTAGRHNDNCELRIVNFANVANCEL